MLSVIQAGWRRLPAHFWVGLALLVVGHLLIFGRSSGGGHLRPFSDYSFAAVWYGYIFVLDALVWLRDGHSIFMSQRRLFLAMLPLSAAMWWGFEWVNGFVQNWRYERPYDIPDWWANMWAGIFFSTVIPAIWETADWVRAWRVIGNIRPRQGFAVPRYLPLGLIALGVLFFVLPVIWPLYFFPLIWGFLTLILDSINFMRGAPSILGHFAKGEWRAPVAFYLGGQICGILWEFWNYWAFPKWYYTIPFVGFFKIFEMPLLGYIGYGPFAWEIYSLFWFVVGLIPSVRSTDLKKLDRRLVEE